MKNKFKLKILCFFLLSVFAMVNPDRADAASTLPYSGSCSYQGGVSTSMPCGHTLSVGSGQNITSGSASITVSNVAGNVSTTGYIQVGSGVQKPFFLYGNGSVSTPTAYSEGDGDQTFTLNFTTVSTDPTASQQAGGGASFSMTAVYEGSPTSTNSGGACDNDGVQESNEQCDGSDFNGQTCNSLGYNEGTLNCTPNCLLDLGMCRSISRTCGNGIAEASEQCDGNDFRGNSCESIGYGGGTLNCNANCTWAVAACVPGGGGGGSSSGGDSGGVNYDPNLSLSICRSGSNPPCTSSPTSTAGDTVQLVDWYSTNAGSSWIDATDTSVWSLCNSSDNHEFPLENGYQHCRGLTLAPYSLYGPYTKGLYFTPFANTDVCSSNGSGCPSINANNGGTGDQKTIRVSSPPPPPPPAAFDYSLSNSGTVTVAKSNSLAYGQGTITRTLTLGTTQIVSLSASGVPSGVSYAISSACSPTCASTITFTVDPSAAAGTYPITITGNPLGKTTTFNLVITSNPISVTCTVSPTSVSIGQPVTFSSSVSGGSAPYTYAWSGTSIPVPAPDESTYNTSFDTIGYKSVRVLVTDNAFQEASCNSVSLFVNFSPTFREF